MRITRLLLFSFVLLFCLSGKNGEVLLNMKKIAKKFPYGKLKAYRITDDLKLTAPINGELFFQFFQKFSSTPPTDPGECGCAIYKQVFEGDDFMLGNHGRAKNLYSDDSVDVVTVLTNYKGKSEIHVLCYASHDWAQKESWIKGFKKGHLTLRHRVPTLAEKYQTDSTSFESYSEFYNERTFRKISVLKSKSGICLDSTIRIYSIDYIDMTMHEDGARYKNGKLEYDFINKDLRKQLGY